jgi:hypothetical protein
MIHFLIQRKRNHLHRSTNMKNALTIGGALLALAAIASPADARMMGGTNMPSSMSRGDVHIPAPSSLGSLRTFSPDGHTFSSNGHTFSADGLQARVKGSNWKKPIDADGGGPDDPPKKAPKGSTQTSSGGDGPTSGYDAPHYGPWNPNHYGSGNYGGDSGPPLACRGRPGGC